MAGNADEEITETLEADYLVIGGGAMGLAFADGLERRPATPVFDGDRRRPRRRRTPPAPRQ